MGMVWEPPPDDLFDLRRPDGFALNHTLGDSLSATPATPAGGDNGPQATAEAGGSAPPSRGGRGGTSSLASSPSPIMAGTLPGAAAAGEGGGVGSDGSQRPLSSSVARRSVLSVRSDETVSAIVALITDEAGFLVEDKVRR